MDRTDRTAATVPDPRPHAKADPDPGPDPRTRHARYAIETRDLRKTYRAKGNPDGVRALDGLDLTVAPGTVFGLLGPNGAGKSTTVKILTTLASADSGTAFVGGVDVARDPAAVRRMIGVVAQGSGADPVATGRENLVLHGRLYGLRGRDLARRADELLERLGLADAARRPVKTYSGGMLRRLDLALGLVHRPEVLFLDEPTTGLDPEGRAELWAEIARLADGDGMTILLTTHYLDEADRLAARLAIVDHGKVVAEGTPDGLKSELRGDAVHVELRVAAGPDAEERIRGALLGLDGIGDVTVAGVRVSARADSGAAAVPAVLAALDRAGEPAAAVTVARPSLDDVYLRYAGRRFGDADALATTALGGVR
ncbi:ABC transporter ATP-binding protein [Yinghuangia seranimata]|uniref:ABC transporter ATP-binding protein n=1 Tax=Yinghuangia seranimata TaxID=408067 RepID=UPI00248C6DF4|nr:ATP-binding cassette domain-containing protein [Yinghuangia seranimata]MDI2126532.1 ATP-binding cassette domain-containing protein [Yinghuangia seranimata]